MGPKRHLNNQEWYGSDWILILCNILVVRPARPYVRGGHAG